MNCEPEKIGQAEDRARVPDDDLNPTIRTELSAHRDQLAGDLDRAVRRKLVGAGRSAE